MNYIGNYSLLEKIHRSASFWKLLEEARGSQKAVPKVAPAGLVNLLAEYQVEEGHVAQAKAINASVVSKNYQNVWILVKIK